MGITILSCPIPYYNSVLPICNSHLQILIFACTPVLGIMLVQGTVIYGTRIYNEYRQNKNEINTFGLR